MDLEIIVVSLQACQRLLPPTSQYRSRIDAELARLEREARAETMRPHAPANGAKIGATIDTLA